jgi:hypothetical protein
MRLGDFASPKNARNNDARQLLCSRTAAHDTRASHHSDIRDGRRSRRPQSNRSAQSDPCRSRAHRTVDGCLGLFSRGSSAIRAELRSSVAGAQARRAFDLIAAKPSACRRKRNGTRARTNSCDTGARSLFAPKTQRFPRPFRCIAAPFIEPENRSLKGLRIRQFL